METDIETLNSIITLGVGRLPRLRGPLEPGVPSEEWAGGKQILSPYLTHPAVLPFALACE